MKQAIKSLILACLATILLPHASIAQNMADGLQCPSDWTRTKRVPPLWNVSHLLKQCTPQTNDAVIQLYSKRTSNSLLTEIEQWTQRLRSKGLPYQKMLNELPGHVSGYPAILRFFSGYDHDGKWYDSYLVVSRYKGINYTFIGYAMKGHERVRIQMRNAMNAWYFPGVSGPTNSGYSNTNTNNNNQQNLPGPNPVISQNTNPNANVNINPTINVNRPGCTRQTSQSSTYTNTINDSGNTYQNRPDPKPDNNNNPDTQNNDGNNQNNNRPSDNKYLDYMLE
ncbi:hypothetical protein [Desulfovibrio sp. JC010]|uniref:hypothetical protein n=1 Tax=Desulfovibrio sp. JC010 TaxID=2593641 RepID=UPI0013D07217|nr:hypothetical protein [Desulfovibrio sp. JC010]NDV26384.1 hypothetical protein [Desulfovibrio sp. JC010]